MKKFILLAFLSLPVHAATTPNDTLREGVNRGFLPKWLSLKDYVFFRQMNGRTYACITDFETGAHWITYTSTGKFYIYFRTLTWQWGTPTPLVKQDYEICRFPK